MARRKAAAPAPHLKPQARPRRFCPRHPSYPIGDATATWDCIACVNEERERDDWRRSEQWHEEGARLPDTIAIPTGDGAPLTFSARPRRRR